jgi:hypothetical protein
VAAFIILNPSPANKDFILSATPVVLLNTAIFLLGSVIFFMDAVNSGATSEGMGTFGYLIVFFVGLNFVFELVLNIIVSPAILRLINIKKKN